MLWIYEKPSPYKIWEPKNSMKKAWLSQEIMVLYLSSPHHGFRPQESEIAPKQYAKVAELADAHVWGACGLSLGVRVPSLAPEGKSVFDLPFFYEQKWWNGRHAGFRHQFLVSEGSSPFFCITWKTAWILENSVFMRLFVFAAYQILSNTNRYLHLLAIRKSAKSLQALQGKSAWNAL